MGGRKVYKILWRHLWPTTSYTSLEYSISVIPQNTVKLRYNDHGYNKQNNLLGLVQNNFMVIANNFSNIHGDYIISRKQV